MLVGCLLPDLMPYDQAVFTLTFQPFTPSNYSITAQLLWYEEFGQDPDSNPDNNEAITWLDLVGCVYGATRCDELTP